MIVAAVLNGWTSSLAETRTSQIVLEELRATTVPHKFLGLKSLFFYPRSERVKRFATSNDSPTNKLLCVGKSLGAYHMVTRVLNRCTDLAYKRIILLTIDINYPTLCDCTPNLNKTVVKLTEPVTQAVNLYVHALEPRQQAGALLKTLPGVPCKNKIVDGANHYSIVEAPMVRREIRKAIEELRGS